MVSEGESECERKERKGPNNGWIDGSMDGCTDEDYG